ncbi:MAG: CoA transferase [Acidimicrobiia bacterium]|nr:CoA transferase [Acidimicrobiia bacterium]
MSGPLSDITVVDLSRVLAGPYATMVLADLGARVIKVEPPGGGDDARRFGPFVGGRSVYYESLNRGKTAVMLDLKDDAHRLRFEALLDGADVLVENYRPGALERLGYGWDELSARWPGLVYAAVSGFGHSGPYAERPAYDMGVQAMGGLMSLTGVAGGPPVRVGTSVGDITAGLFAVAGILSALHDRNRTGRGQMVDIAMLDCQVAILENAIARHSATGEVPGPLGARHPSITPFGVFRAANRPIVIAAGNNGLFRRLCATLGRPEWADDLRFLDNHARTRHADELGDEIETVLRDEQAEVWLKRLERAGVPSGPINDIADVMADPAVRARNMIVGVDLPDGTKLEIAGNPIKLSAHEDPSTRPAAPDTLDGP